MSRFLTFIVIFCALGVSPKAEALPVLDRCLDWTRSISRLVWGKTTTPLKLSEDAEEIEQAFEALRKQARSTTRTEVSDPKIEFSTQKARLLSEISRLRLTYETELQTARNPELKDIIPSLDLELSKSELRTRALLSRFVGASTRHPFSPIEQNPALEAARVGVLRNEMEFLARLDEFIRIESESYLHDDGSDFMASFDTPMRRDLRFRLDRMIGGEMDFPNNQLILNYFGLSTHLAERPENRPMQVNRNLGDAEKVQNYLNYMELHNLETVLFHLRLQLISQGIVEP